MKILWPVLGPPASGPIWCSKEHLPTAPLGKTWGLWPITSRGLHGPVPDRLDRCGTSCPSCGQPWSPWASNSGSPSGSPDATRRQGSRGWRRNLRILITILAAFGDVLPESVKGSGDVSESCGQRAKASCDDLDSFWRAADWLSSDRLADNPDALARMALFRGIPQRRVFWALTAQSSGRTVRPSISRGPSQGAIYGRNGPFARTDSPSVYINRSVFVGATPLLVGRTVRPCI